ncbi:sciellin isoform X2 [Narcine bancroftii]|uniref:sciellin isoform X2 n=1 Tax=Narcine bancroftii TaxID=1343680 RepID=UPI003832093C
MALFQKLSSTFSANKSPSSGDRDQVINETKRKSRLMKDDDWIRNTPSDDPSKAPADKNYGKLALNQVKTEENVNSYSSGTNKPTSARYDPFDGKKRTTEIKKDDLPKMTIITSESKIESPTRKSLQSRPSPDGRVTTQDKTFLKISTKNEPAPLIDLTPTTEKPTKRSSNFMSRFGSKSLIDLSTDPEKTHERTPDATSNSPVKTSSLIDLASTDPSKDKRSSGDWDNTTSSTTSSTFDPTSRKSRSSGDWDNTTSSTTSSTFDPTSRKSRSSGDWDNTTSSTTSSTFDPTSRKSSTNKEDLDSIYSWTDSKDNRPTKEKDVFDDEATSKTRTTFSYNSSEDKSPGTDGKPYSSRFSYKENSPPNVKPFDDYEYSSNHSSNYSLPRIKNSSSSLSDGKSPAKVITLTTAYTSTEQTTKDKNLCSQCFKPFNGSPKMILSDLKINCHASCLKCQICNKSLENLSAGDCLWVHLNTVHCKNCIDNVMDQLEF